MSSSHFLSILEQIVPLIPGYAYLQDKNLCFRSCTIAQAQAFGLTHPQEITGCTTNAIPLFVQHPELLNTINAINTQMLHATAHLTCEEPTLNTKNHLILMTYHKIPLLDEQQTLVGLLSLGAKDNHYASNELALKNILLHLPGHVYWKDKEGHYLGCNLLQAKDLNLTNSDDIIGKTDYDLSPKDKADLFRNIDKQVVLLGKTIDTEEEIIKNEQTHIVLSKKTPLYDEHHQIIGLLGISFDITDRKKMEAELHQAKDAAEQANRAKTEFLTNMRHDIRTPLSGIVGFSELLHSESTEPRIKEYAENLVASSHALLDLMDEVLEAVRVSSGEVPLLKRKFDLHHTLNQVIALYQARAMEKQLTLTLDLSPTLPRFVIGDKIRLHRIALELIGNALNFTNKGQVTIEATLAKKKHRTLVIKLTVSDTGMGIPNDKQHEIYLQFKRLTPSYQGIYKGAGLGLYVVKQFIDELEGEIYVTSEVNKGTKFTCLIPLQKPLLEDDTEIAPEEDLKMLHSYMKPLSNQLAQKEGAQILNENKAVARVLIVEDNLIAQTVACALLSRLSCLVDVASNGAEALSLCTNTHYDLIFMDIGLGEGMDGYDVTYQIRHLSSPIKDTPIIALTAHGGDENKQRCIEAGMDAVLTKPLTHLHASDILKTFLFTEKPSVAKDQSVFHRDLPDNDFELFQLEQFSLFDEQQALKNCDNKKDMLRELLVLLVQQELPNDLQQMKEAFTRQEYPAVEKIAHKIKGGAVYVCTIRMKYACQYLERYWKTGARELFDELYHQAIITIEQTMVHIENWLHH